MYIIEDHDYGFHDGPETASEWVKDPNETTTGCPTDAEGEE